MFNANSAHDPLVSCQQITTDSVLKVPHYNSKKTNIKVALIRPHFRLAILDTLLVRSETLLHFAVQLCMFRVIIAITSDNFIFLQSQEMLSFDMCYILW